MSVNRGSVEVLEKSKNVRRQTTNLTEEQRSRRLEMFARSKGFEPQQSHRDFIGSNETNIVDYRPSESPGFGLAHELGHALQTPVGQTIRSHQAFLGAPPGQGRPNETRAGLNNENTAGALEPMIRRRAGIRFDDDPTTWRGLHHSAVVTDRRNVARKLIERWDAGRDVDYSHGRVRDPNSKYRRDE